VRLVFRVGDLANTLSAGLGHHVLDDANVGVDVLAGAGVKGTALRG
jgi:hypothetical protein